MANAANTWNIHRTCTADVYNAVVQRYTLSGSPVVPQDKNSILHWRIFVNCLAHDGQSSITVRLDMIPGIDAGILTVASVQYELSASSVAHVSEVATATGKITVHELLKMLGQNGRNLYRFDENGTGCVWWCRTVLGDFERQELVSGGAVKRFDAYYQGKNHRNPKRFPLPTPLGTFYTIG
ncbi:hypothetical protein PAXRUDRAFT_831755 [Paxillus rubicundulus Ve08.2h10]|uniref:DUF7770 domain-containing protein n=1 Tax=Paxillus rubicundulus Ve08.2h10 TaxID=930991 RepID=A0A0D0DQX9_9AGAM|nr:hypothetical protein PAXRUDRAFT_831755 [Paxillus rubicundulus Ve08.2h10]